MRKPTRIVTDPEEVRRIVANQPPTTREAAIRSIRIQNGLEKPRPFVERFLAGDRPAGDIDDFVDIWHESKEDNGSLASFLGFSDEEYAAWVEGRLAIADLPLIRSVKSVWPRPWRTWKKNQRYEKMEYDVMLPDGIIVERCWPNAGKINATDGSGRSWGVGTKFRRAANPRLADVPICFQHLHNRPRVENPNPDQPYTFDVGEHVMIPRCPEDGVFVIDRRSRNSFSGTPLYSGHSLTTDTRMSRVPGDYLRSTNPSKCNTSTPPTPQKELWKDYPIAEETNTSKDG